MSIKPDQAAHVAALARLSLSPEELVAFGGQLAEVLAYFEQLAEVRTEGIEPTSHAVALSCPLRDDAESQTGLAEAILSQAPAREGDLLSVPRVIE